MSKVLTRQDISEAATLLGVEPAALRAVTDVESGGVGFLPDGRPKILFEAHVFWGQLKQRGIDPVLVRAKHPTICQPTWAEGRKHYLGGSREYGRLALAETVHRLAAWCSASWGLFQLMGFNWKSAGFASIWEFEEAHHESERQHLLAICRWIQSNSLARRLAVKDWKAFARGYNGPGQVPVYSARLHDAYNKRVAQGWNASTA